MRPLNGPRSVILAAGIVALALASREMMPRYDIRPLGDGPGFVRIDRWTGRADVATLRTPAAWLHVRTEAEAAASSPVPTLAQQLPTWRDVAPLATLAALMLVIWKGPDAIARLRRRGARAAHTT
jgi:hypothetical protein